MRLGGEGWGFGFGLRGVGSGTAVPSQLGPVEGPQGPKAAKNTSSREDLGVLRPLPLPLRESAKEGLAQGRRQSITDRLAGGPKSGTARSCAGWSIKAPIAVEFVIEGHRFTPWEEPRTPKPATNPPPSCPHGAKRNQRNVENLRGPVGTSEAHRSGLGAGPGAPQPSPRTPEGSGAVAELGRGRVGTGSSWDGIDLGILENFPGPGRSCCFPFRTPWAVGPWPGSRFEVRTSRMKVRCFLALGPRVLLVAAAGRGLEHRCVRTPRAVRGPARGGPRRPYTVRKMLHFAVLKCSYIVRLGTVASPTVENSTDCIRCLSAPRVPHPMPAPDPLNSFVLPPSQLFILLLPSFSTLSLFRNFSPTARPCPLDFFSAQLLVLLRSTPPVVSPGPARHGSHDARGPLGTIRPPRPWQP